MSKKIFYRILLAVIILIILYFSISIFQKDAQAITPANQLKENELILETKATDYPLFQYIEVTDSCGPYFGGQCVNVRSGPSTEFSVVTRLRTGVVLKVAETVTRGTQKWYKIELDKVLLRPERITGDWFVADGDYIKLFTDVGDQQLLNKKPNLTTKHIIVNLSKEMLYAYDGDNLFMQEPISTGLEFTPTPNGTFIVYKKTPSRYMQGPEKNIEAISNDIGSSQYYDLPGVPWDLYFTYDGDVIHGTYWHDHFGQRWSHGCVNLPSDKAKKLYKWADIGTPVIVKH